MRGSAQQPAARAAGRILVRGAAAAVVCAFADVQFVQWTSTVIRPALVAFAAALDLGFFVPLALGLSVASHLGHRYLPPMRRIADVVPVAGCTAIWLASRVRMGHLQEPPSYVAVIVPCAALLALGLALAAWLRARVGEGWALPSTLVLANVLILALSFPAAPGFERPVRRDIPSGSSARPDDPDIILIVLDTLRADHMSTYGYGFPTTPNIDEFAATATVFERGVANAAWSLPSHASLFTGLLPHQHGAHAVITGIRQTPEERAVGGQRETYSFAQRPLAAEYETLAETLAGRGYTTAAVAANYGWITEFFGLVQGFHYVDNRPMNLVRWEPVAAPYLRRLRWEAVNRRYDLLNKSAWFAESIVAHARAWEAGRPPGPAHLFLNFMDPHGPYRASSLYSGPDDLLPAPDAAAGPAARNIARYDRSVAYLDAQIGELLRFLREVDLYDDSLIVLTSDHGEDFRLTAPSPHGAELYQATVAVPLIVKLPGQTRGRRVARPGQLIDVVPTVRHLLGLEQDPAAFGSPLGESSRAVVAENYFSALSGRYSHEFYGTETEMLATYPSRWALFEGPWKLIRRTSGPAQLFDLRADPAGRHDVGDGNVDRARAMEGRLLELLPASAIAAAHAVTRIELPDTATVRRLRSLGYIR